MKKIIYSLILVFSLLFISGCSTEINVMNTPKELVDNDLPKPALMDNMTEKTMGDLTFQFPEHVRFLDYKSNDNLYYFKKYLGVDDTVWEIYVESGGAKGRNINSITTNAFAGLDSETDMTGTKVINGATWTTAHNKKFYKSENRDVEAYGYGIIIDDIYYHVSITFPADNESARADAKKIEESLYLTKVYK